MTRRISVARSASGDGASPSRSSRARTKRSIGLRGQLASCDRGQRRALRRDQATSAAATSPPARSSGGAARSGRGVSCRPAAGRRHPLGVVLGRDPPEQLARLGVAGHDRRAVRRGRRAAPSSVSSRSFGLALGRVRAVAGEAVVGEDRPDVAVELDRRPGAADRGRRNPPGHGGGEHRRREIPPPSRLVSSRHLARPVAWVRIGLPLRGHRTPGTGRLPRRENLPKGKRERRGGRRLFRGKGWPLTQTLPFRLGEVAPATAIIRDPP